MTDFWLLMGKPFLACLVLGGIHGYLGIHIVERKVIFVDLSLAQIAALGASIAFLFGHELHGPVPYWFSLGATVIGAVIFSVTRSAREKVPQEAVIGIVYAVSAALAILILSHAAEGDEHIRYMMIGNILLVSDQEIIKMAVIYSLIGLIHWRFRETFTLISCRPAEAYQKGIPVKRWDLLFYLTFGVVVTSSVQAAGVLLVFTFLIVPAVVAMLWSNNFFHRLLLGWGFAGIASLAGITLSYVFDWPTGAAIISTFGLFLLVSSVVRKIIRPAASF